MRSAVLVLAAAAGIGLAAWVVGSREQRKFVVAEWPRASPAPAHPAQSPQPTDEPALERPAETATTARDRAPSSEEPAIPGSPDDYGLSPELRPALQSYREARGVAERENPLLDLALSDDPAVLDFLLDELRAANPANRQQLLDALLQYGSRAAIPELRRLAGLASSAQERRVLLDAADYLALPSFTELRKGKLAPGTR